MTDIYQVSNYTPCQIGLVKGERGENGANGANGLNGKDGKDGKDGLRGLSGSDGKSNYQLALDAGFIGSLDDYLLSMKADATEINERIDSIQSDVELQKLDTGITATAKFGGVERSQADKNLDFISIKDFGAVGDGVADDTLAFQKAFQSHNSIELKPSEIYRITDTVNLPTGSVLNGNNATIYVDYTSGTGFRKGILEAKGEVTTTTTECNAAISLGDETIVVTSTTGFSVGDAIHISSTEYKHGLTGESGFGVKYKGEWNTIQNIVGNTMYLMEGAKDNYDASIKNITKVLPSKNISLKDIRFLNKSYDGVSDGERGIRAVFAEQVFDFEIHGCSFTGFKRFSVEINGARNVSAVGNYLKGWIPTDESLNYEGSDWYTGVSCTGVDGFLFSGNKTVNSRRGVDVDTWHGYPFSRNIVISNNIDYNGFSSYGTHSAENIIVTGNKGSSAISCRGMNVSISNNIVLDKIHVGRNHDWNNAYNEPLTCGQVVISGNTILQSSYKAIMVTGDVDSLIITSNTVKRGAAKGIEVQGKVLRNIQISNNTLETQYTAISIPNTLTVPTSVLDSLSISNNIIDHIKGGILIEIGGASKESPAKNIKISGNSITATDGDIIRVFSLSTTTYANSTPAEQSYYSYGVSITNNSVVTPNSRNLIDSHMVICTAVATHGNMYPQASRTEPLEVYASTNTASYGFTYEIGMRSYEREYNPLKPLMYVCTKAGTTHNGSVSGKASISSGSDIMTITEDTGNLQYGEGRYINIGGSGLSETTKIISYLGDDKYRLSEEASTTVSNAKLGFTAPEFEAVGYSLKGVYNGLMSTDFVKDTNGVIRDATDSVVLEIENSGFTRFHDNEASQRAKSSGMTVNRSGSTYTITNCGGLFTSGWSFAPPIYEDTGLPRYVVRSSYNADTNTLTITGELISIDEDTGYIKIQDSIAFVNGFLSVRLKPLAT